MSGSVATDRARLPRPNAPAPHAGRAAVARQRDAAGPSVEVAGRPMPVLELQRAAGNRAAAIALGRAGHDAPAVPTIQRRPQDGETSYADEEGNVPPSNKPKPPRKMTGYIGMNPGANKELTKLKKSAGDDNVLSTMGDAKLEAQLGEDSAIAEFVVDDLRIPKDNADRFNKAVETLKSTNLRSRDTVGELMRWMNRAEKGEIVLDRLVLSGHSNGVELWGTPSSPHAPEKPGVVIIEQELGNVAAVFPGAAAQVRSVMFSACETVGAVESVVKVFPNIDSVWAYAGFSPSIDQGSGEHIGTWQAATAGGGTPDRKAAKGATAIWTRKDKFIVHDPGKGNYATMFAHAATLFEGPVKNMMKGTREIDLTELHSIYLRIQEVFQHPGAPADKKAAAKIYMQVILRLRHWESIRRHFAETRGPETKLVEAYKTFGMTPPSWGSITRAELFQHMRAINKRSADWKGDQGVLDTFNEYIFEGLFGLENEKMIPVEWNE